MTFPEAVVEFFKIRPHEFEDACARLAPNEGPITRSFAAVSRYILIDYGVTEEFAENAVQTSVPDIAKNTESKADIPLGRIYWVLIRGKYFGLRLADKTQWWDWNSGAVVTSEDVLRRPPIEQLLLDPMALCSRLITPAET
jgi:hypothetical protein